MNSFLAVTRIASHEEYVVYANKRREERARRKITERILVRDEKSFTVLGWCFVCRKYTPFEVDFSYSYAVDGELTPNWREQLKCPHCGLNNRMRAAIHILEQECAVQPEHCIYVTEQITPLFLVLRRRYLNVIGSEYLGATPPFGMTNQEGVRNESVTRLTFPDATFDHILCFDVLEHVPDYAKGLAECFRCLRPGGKLLFGVPFGGNRVTFVRARVHSNGTVEHLRPPEYHANPASKCGCLCFYHFGWDLLEALRVVGFAGATSLFYWSREFGYLGNGDQIIFLAQKPR